MCAGPRYAVGAGCGVRRGGACFLWMCSRVPGGRGGAGKANGFVGGAVGLRAGEQLHPDDVTHGNEHFYRCVGLWDVVLTWRSMTQVCAGGVGFK